MTISSNIRLLDPDTDIPTCGGSSTRLAYEDRPNIEVVLMVQNGALRSELLDRLAEEDLDADSNVWSPLARAGTSHSGPEMKLNNHRELVCYLQ
jgi:hypothetical protein